VACGPVAAQQSSGAEHQRTGAHAAHPPGARSAIREKRDRAGVAQQIQRGLRTTTDEEHVRLTPGILEAMRGVYPEAAVSDNGPGLSPHVLNVVIR
jgi:hypothetical protein